MAEQNKNATKGFEQTTLQAILKVTEDSLAGLGMNMGGEDSERVKKFVWGVNNWFCLMIVFNLFKNFVHD